MKKIIYLIAIAAASHICAAEDDFNDLLALADLSDFAGESLLFKFGRTNLTPTQTLLFGIAGATTTTHPYGKNPLFSKT